MATSNTTEFRVTGESVAFAALIDYHGLSSADVLERLYNKLDNLGHTTIYELNTLTVAGNRIIIASYKTIKGTVGIRMNAQSTPGVYDFSLVDYTTNTNELLFTMADKERALGGEPAD